MQNHPFQWRLSLIGLVLLITGSLQAASIHLIIVADTCSHTGENAVIELKHVQEEFARVVELTHMELKQQVYDGLDARNDVCTAIERLQPEEDDCVVFYYIGHGYRVSRKKTPWPLLYFSREGVNLDLQDVIESVILKKPRFGLIIADCCNNVMDGKVTIGRTPLFFWRRDPATGYRQLFEKSTGIVVVSAAKPGDYAYCDDYGHCYSQAFWKVLHTQVMEKDPQWRSILDHTANALQSVQTPYDEIFSYP